METENRIKLAASSKFLDSPDFVQIFDGIVSAIKHAKIVENTLVLSGERKVNIIDVGFEPKDADSMFGLKCIVTIGDIEGVEKTKSLLDRKGFCDFGVLTKRKLIWKPVIPNIYYFLSDAHVSTEFTYILCRTCDIISNFTIEYRDHNRTILSNVEDDKLKYCKVDIVMGNCTLHYPECYSGKTYAMGLNMLREETQFNHIKLTVTSVGDSLHLNVIKITIGEIFLNPETRKIMHAEELMLDIHQ
jgi:hypothetical protein